MSTIEWHHSKSDATTFNLTVYNKKTQELSALVLGDSPTFIFKEDEYIRTKESTMNEGKAPLQIDSRQLQLFGGKYWCVDNFYPNLSRRRNLILYNLKSKAITTSLALFHVQTVVQKE